MSNYLSECRYNHHHKVKKTKLIIHELNCPDKTSEIETCVFNVAHKYNVKDREIHRNTCESRIKWIGKDLLEKDNFLKEKRGKYQQIQEIENKKEETKENYIISYPISEVEQEKQEEKNILPTIKKETDLQPEIIEIKEEVEENPSNYQVLKLQQENNKGELTVNYVIKVEIEKEVDIIYETVDIKSDTYEPYEGEAFINSF